MSGAAKVAITMGVLTTVFAAAGGATGHFLQNVLKIPVEGDANLTIAMAGVGAAAGVIAAMFSLINGLRPSGQQVQAQPKTATPAPGKLAA